MIGYAVKQDGSWRCVDTDNMKLDDDEKYQSEEPAQEESTTNADSH